MAKAEQGDPLQDDIEALARELTRLGEGHKTRVYRMSWSDQKLMNQAMARPAFKTQLFRLVDVFPALRGSRDVVEHVDDYLSPVEGPKGFSAALATAKKVPGGRALTARITRRSIKRMASQFIAGQNPQEAATRVGQLWRQGFAHTVDLLGEKTVTPAEADTYAARVHALLVALTDAAARWPTEKRLETDDRGPIPRVQVSVKPTALGTHLDPLGAEHGLAAVRERLVPLLHLARERGALITLDMEHDDIKALTLDLLESLATDPALAEVELGCVVQAYRIDAREDLARVIELSRARPTPLSVRLVKGAYWDTETVEAEAHGWPSPVFATKPATDASYEVCTSMLLDAHGSVRPQFASHNLRSLAHAIAYARRNGVPDDAYELQMLYGMAEPLQVGIRELGLRLRVYCPVGELVPGMAYLVRRLLENTSNESFVRQRFAEGRDVAELVRPPDAGPLPDPPRPSRGTLTDITAIDPYDPEPELQWQRPEERSAFTAAVRLTSAAGTVDVPAVIDGQRVRTTSTLDSPDPAQPSRVVARSAACGPDEADRAVAVAVRAAAEWAATPPSLRADILVRAAQWMRARRAEIAALEVFEAGKPWDQADADVCEAIDFCEYYARHLLDLTAESARVQSPPGEDNTLRYVARGPTVVIAPWNFPLAIATGMTTAALVTGNPVILKPAEQTPAVALRLVEALEAAGLPAGVIGFLPGLGEEVGARLVAHPDVATIAFTGSLAVGTSIMQTAASVAPGQRQLKRVVAELGGKNAIIVDTDADPDQAVPGAVYSAFGFAGQKCSAASRLIVLEEVYDSIVERVAAATRDMVVGHPRDPAVQVGPLIDAEAQERVQGMIARAGDAGARVLVARDDVPAEGFFVGPTVVADVDPDSELATAEVFGPVLAVMKVPDLDAAIALANAPAYALTAGIFSRSPSRIRYTVDRLRAGNVYVNRHITGAVVGRQPFGGRGLSGIGHKAGGPDYLTQFMDTQAISENTLRQGFVPEA